MSKYDILNTNKMAFERTVTLREFLISRHQIWCAHAIVAHRMHTCACKTPSCCIPVNLGIVSLLSLLLLLFFFWRFFFLCTTYISLYSFWSAYSVLYLDTAHLQYRPRALQLLHARKLRAIWRISTQNPRKRLACKFLHELLHADFLLANLSVFLRWLIFLIKIRASCV